MAETIDREFELPAYSPVCVFCKHLRSIPDRTCDAFPDGVPAVIWRGDNDHREPFAGDSGIQFERIDAPG